MRIVERESEEAQPVMWIAQNVANRSDKEVGADQLAWLKADLGALSASTPVVLFAHIPALDGL